MTEEKDRKALTEKVERGVEYLLLSDEFCEDEKAAILRAMLSLIEKPKG